MNDTRTLFETDRFTVRDLLDHEVVDLQRLFEANPAFFLVTTDQRPPSTEAQDQFDSGPPSFLTYSKRWFAGVFDRAGALQGVIHCVSDLGVKDVWHINFFFLAEALRGAGEGATLHAALEAWMKRSGAAWVRLGVARGNTLAERFWQRMGYLPTCVRASVDVGQGKIGDILMQVKPLAGGTREQYYVLVPRDKPPQAPA